LTFDIDVEVENLYFVSTIVVPNLVRCVS